MDNVIDQIVKAAREKWPEVMHFELLLYFQRSYIEPWHLIETGSESWSENKIMLSAPDLPALLAKLQEPSDE